ncbi:MAG TPA: response regulator transcription factor [Gaiellaceae bacterium]|jgi:DNA-binding NarL/FixJ family response regulator|nr:response regulator transcription factor [Gaiellaceae bacterium]
MRHLDLKIFLVDDHALMREAVGAILDGAGGLRLVGDADSFATALRRIAELQPDIVLLDLRLPDVEGLSGLTTLRRLHPTISVVVFSALDEPELISSALARGASGYIVKRIDPLDLPAALRQTVDRSVYHRETPSVAAPTAGLSEKELRVLEQLALGRSNREIASELWVSDQTVKFHLRNVYRKLGATTRTDAIRIAHERALLTSAA